MANLLSGLRVLDLSQGVAGPMTAVLLADHGASVVRVEPPTPGTLGDLPGYRVWNRGKRTVALDLKTPESARALDELLRTADVLVESFAPGARARLDLGYDRLHALNPRLVHCSITGYGEGNSHSDRPAYDALVAARCGLHWEKRGWPGGGINRQAGLPPMFDDLEVPPGAVEGPERDGPLFFGLPLPSIGAFYLAATGIQAALYVRETTGRGQHVQTSLLQGAFSALIGGWQRIERTDMPFLQTWIFDGRAPLFNFRCKDGTWVHAWVPNPSWTLAMAELDSLDDAPDEVVAGTSHRDDPDRLGPDPENLVVVQYYYPLMAEAFAKFPAAEWLRAAARKGLPLQEVRSPAQALADPWWAEDGCVVELDDPVEGPIRMVGRTYTTGPGTGAPQAPAPGAPVDVAEIGWDARPPAPAGTGHVVSPAAPLSGVRVLDLGVAVAGPYGCQVLGDLGADVIKVNALHDGYWQSTHVAMTCNRNKRSLAVNLKDPRGLAVLHRLVAEADVVQHNMRYDAAVRLGVDEATLRAVRPDLVYCHTRGFESDGPRVQLPGNDQTGAALAGVEWEDGGVDDGGRPIWSRVNFGDTGNGFLSAIGIMQALAHRSRTGEGSRVDTSIAYAQLLATSGTFLRADGTEPDRPRLDAQQLGLNALYRLYRCRDDRWLCVAAVGDERWDALSAVLAASGPEWTPGAADDARFADAAARRDNDGELAKLLGEVFAADDADAWAARLDAAGVPAEVSSETFSLGVFDDPEMVDRRWVAKFEHPYVGSFESIGLGVDFSETPGVLWGPPPVVGEHTPEVLAEFGFAPEEIARLTDAGVLRTWRPGEPVLPPR
ncbi:CoA transferase [Streptomycetaceae bacterium NBC_01309]